jgi:hypothetical protein
MTNLDICDTCGSVMVYKSCRVDTLYSQSTLMYECPKCSYIYVKIHLEQALEILIDKALSKGDNKA